MKGLPKQERTNFLGHIHGLTATAVQMLAAGKDLSRKA
jgi:hypothetical protein